MPEIQLHNTLSGKVEPFVPQKPGEVRIYTCGPTVYDYAHIGNYRTFVFQDILRRFLKLRGFKLHHVMNLTDVDDRIIANAAAAGKNIRDYTEKFAQAFFDDCKMLSIEAPEQWVRATDHIDDMVQLIQRLQEKTFTYPSEGSIYYRIAKFPNYGKLSKIDLSGIQAGARVDNDRYEKESARDFALWKAPKPGEHFWETAIGPGRPGWHIECSAMAMKYLGETLDIHTGGIDLAFPHHENEIAQSEAATGKPFARYWLHAEHLLVEGEKMSKSLGNFFTLRDLFAKGYKPSALRFALASVPYRKQLNFTFDGLKQATNSVERLRNFADRLKQAKFPAGKQDGMAARIAKAAEEFDAGLSDDLNTARALAAVFDLVREANIAMDKGEFRQGDVAAVQNFLATFDRVFAVLEDNDAEKLRALGYGSVTGGLTDAEIDKLVAERNAAKKKRDFATADRIRKELADRGIILEDAKDGSVRWKRK
ncbi:MAG: cysteine--tRNA ligase [Acidobacteria bacterium]|nr:MAG: cysteine--tRNA ligase [Acidobacteria bacterium 13_1_40CM_4_58_4]PYT58967.1 MAG: cysteine--tRNA ligase [Acidobacteriota bacterium]